MVKEQATPPVRSGRQNSGLDLDQRLRLHRFLSAIGFALQRNHWLLPIAAYLLTMPPMIGLIVAYKGLGALLSFLWCLSVIGCFAWMHQFWESNLVKIAEENSLVAIGPLLDAASLTFLSKDIPAGTPEFAAEEKVFAYLPTLLDRVSVGDGPKLSARQQATLRRLFVSPRYRRRFALPGLEAKIYGMLEK